MSGKIDNVTGTYRSAAAVVNTFRRFFATLVAVTVLGFVTYPLVILVSASLRESSAVIQNPLALPELGNIQFGNYVQAWIEGGFQQYFMNSIVVVGASLLVLLFTTSLAAYALVELNVPKRGLFVFAIIAGFMVPAQALFIPNFMIMNQLNLLNSRLGLVLVYVGFSIPFCFFLIYQSFNDLPNGYADAARVEGVSEFTIFSRIYIPLSLPSLMAVAVVQFVWLWNEFLYALVFVTDDAKRTVPAGLQNFASFFATDWGAYTAGIIISVAPAVFIFYLFQNHFIEGFTRGGV
jgi:ABC-type glycerol-3-phosphate transport system permease component